MSQPVVGWASVDEDAFRLPTLGRRPIGQILHEVAAVYRAEARPLLQLAVLFEGTIAILSLPYIVMTVELGLRMLDLMGRVLRIRITLAGCPWGCFVRSTGSASRASPHTAGSSPSRRSRACCS